MNEIEKATPGELAWNGKPVRTSKDQAVAILVPMFLTYPKSGATDATIDSYAKMLCDLETHVLAKAVLGAMNSCKFLPTIADIREQIESRQPGPSSDVDVSTLKPVPMKMYRPDEDEDRHQRMARLRQTEKWSCYYE